MAYSAEDFFSNYRKTFVIAPFKPSQVTPLGYDLRLGQLFSIEGKKKNPTSGSAVTSNTPVFSIAPEESVLAVTVDRIFLSGKVLGTVHARARLSLRGIFLNAVTVDPNFGYPNFNDEKQPGSRLVFRLKNISKKPVTLTAGDDAIATLILHEVQTETTRRPATNSVTELLQRISEDDSEALSKSVIEEVEKYIFDHSTKPSKDGKRVLDQTEIEFRSAAEDMINFRNMFRSRQSLD